MLLAVLTAAAWQTVSVLAEGRPHDPARAEASQFLANPTRSLRKRLLRDIHDEAALGNVPVDVHYFNQALL